jgi:hypothetical protein
MTRFKTPRRSKFARKNMSESTHRRLGCASAAPERRFLGNNAMRQARAFIAGIAALGANPADLEILQHIDSANPAYSEVVVRPR